MELRAQLSSCFLCAILLATIPFSENFEVISSPTVTGIVGQDVVLPCQISTRTQPDNMEVQWKKIIQVAIETVYEYRAQTGQDVPGQKYQGRTMLLKDGFTTGNVSLKLKNVQPADVGTYSCIVKSNAWSADAATELQIGAVAPVSIDVLGPQGQGIDLACRSTGWFPKPELYWVTKNGQDLQPVTQTKQEHELLFSVLSHVTILGEETGEISCVIQNSLLKTEQQSVILLSGDIFPHGSPWLAAFWVLFTLDLLVIGACVFWGYKEKQKEFKKKASEEESLLKKETGIKKLESECQDFQERHCRSFTELDFRRARSYMVPVTLDPSYKHPECTVSEDGKTVQHRPPSPGPASPSGALIAVGKEGFLARRDHGDEGGICKWYWEVEVGNSLDWELGVLSETVRDRIRLGSLERPPKGGFWALGRSEGRYHPEKTDTLIQSWYEKPTVVGVHLDLEERSLSFYSVSAMVLILEIPVEGSDKVYPFLSLGYTAERDQGKSLSICPPSDWDFPQKLAISRLVNQGTPKTGRQPSTSNNGEETRNNTGPSATGETSPTPGKHSASADQDVKGNRAWSSMVKNLKKSFPYMKMRKGDKTEQENLQEEGRKETPNPRSQKPICKNPTCQKPSHRVKGIGKRKTLRT
nr:butyrophilin subfamily 3 member A1-like [Chelonoidis abingdonii]